MRIIKQGLMKIFLSKDIKKTGEIERKSYIDVLMSIGISISLLGAIAKIFMLLNISIFLFMTGINVMVLGIVIEILILLNFEWSKNKKESRETISNTQEQDKIDKNELMFTREALEKEMSHES